jgi:hypothetical protein
VTWPYCRWWLACSYHTAPLLVTQGGRGSDDLPTRTVGNPEPQPIARKVGWEHGRLAGNEEGWLGTRKVGWERGRLAGNEEGWLGTRKVGWERGRLAGNEEGLTLQLLYCILNVLIYKETFNFFFIRVSAEGSMSMKQYSLNASKSSHICVSLEEDNEFGRKVYVCT